MHCGEIEKMHRSAIEKIRHHSAMLSIDKKSNISGECETVN
jgi:hypothetical protein